MTLASVVVTQIGNLMQRTESTSVFRMRWGRTAWWVGIATELVLLALLIYVPVLQRLLHSTLPLQNWVFLFAWTFICSSPMKAARPWSAAEPVGGYTVVCVRAPEHVGVRVPSCGYEVGHEKHHGCGRVGAGIWRRASVSVARR